MKSLITAVILWLAVTDANHGNLRRRDQDISYNRAVDRMLRNVETETNPAIDAASNENLLANFRSNFNQPQVPLETQREDTNVGEYNGNMRDSNGAIQPSVAQVGDNRHGGLLDGLTYDDLVELLLRDNRLETRIDDVVNRQLASPHQLPEEDSSNIPIHRRHGKGKSRSKRNSTDSVVNDIQFKIPDVTTRYQLGTLPVPLEAYKVVHRNQWVSVGRPYLVNPIYSFTPEAIKVHIRLLDSCQTEALVRAAQARYPNLMVTQDNIALIPLQRFSCETTFIHDGKNYAMKGAVHDFDTLAPILEVQQSYQGSPTRTAFEARINISNDLTWRCSLAAAGKGGPSNVIRITSTTSQWTNMLSSLFGPASEVYVSRQQLNELTQRVKQNLHIEETYEFDDENFENVFKNQLLSLAGSSFQQVDVDEGLSKISKFGLSTDVRDLSPDEIKREWSNKMEVRNESGKEYLHVKTDQEDAGTDNLSHQTEVGGKASGFWGLGQAEASVKFAYQKSKSWKTANRLVNESLRELNQGSQYSMQWGREGNRIVPKSLNLAKLSKANLQRDLVITGVKSKLRDAQYVKVYDLTSTLVNADVRHQCYGTGPIIYVGTVGGLSISEDGGRTWITKTTQHGLGHNYIHSVLVSGWKIYVGTWGGGLSISEDRARTWLTKTTEHGLGSNNIRSVVLLEEKIYVGTLGGLSISEDGGQTWITKTTEHGLGSNNIHSVFVSGSKICVGTLTDGLSISEDGGRTWITKTTQHGLGSNNIQSVLVSRSKIYAGTFGGGLSISEDGGRTWITKTTEHGLGSNKVQSVFVSGSKIYAGTSGGLSISGDGGRTWITKTTEHGLGHNYIQPILVSGSKIYLGTEGGGLSISEDNGQTWITKTTHDGLGNNYIRSVFI